MVCFTETKGKSQRNYFLLIFYIYLIIINDHLSAHLKALQLGEIVVIQYSHVHCMFHCDKFELI